MPVDNTGKIHSDPAKHASDDASLPLSPRADVRLAARKAKEPAPSRPGPSARGKFRKEMSQS